MVSCEKHSQTLYFDLTSSYNPLEPLTVNDYFLITCHMENCFKSTTSETLKETWYDFYVLLATHITPVVVFKEKKVMVLKVKHYIFFQEDILGP